jgi:3-oxoacyl-(acyl-carrier-protein) synthase
LLIDHLLTKLGVAVYIKGMGNISPQKTWDEDALLAQVMDYRADQVKCVEPDYTRWLDSKQIRRMSRILKMGSASAFIALKESGIEKPDAIITGTGYGCLDDTGTFLSKMIESNEQTLNPTPFIQSTHNTIGSAIALFLQCQGYNQTYVQGAFSFENSLLDAIVLLKEEPSYKVLVGGVDETTQASHAILNRFNIYRQNLPGTLKLFKSKGKGTVHGEGAAYFVLSAENGDHDIAAVEGVTTFYKASPDEIRSGVERLLIDNGVKPSEIDFVLLGRSGDEHSDKTLQDITSKLFPSGSIGLFKHLCGEYPVASAFGLWLAARIIKDHHVPDAVIYKDTGRPLKNILVFNQYFGTHHSAMLLKSCRDTL